MKIKKWPIMVAALILLGWIGISVFKPKPPAEGAVKIIHAYVGNIQSVVSSTGTVLPKNRLQVKPPVNGRIEQVLVVEGQHVKVGDILVWMSSTDRAALLDAARGQGADKLKYWQEVYKPIPLSAPIEGDVIVGIIQPGQTVTTADDVVVLSDRLIVRAQVDETDIGKIKLKQQAVITLDAYPDAKINAVVGHIYFESKTVNNVTTYVVDLLPEEVPPFFRSGMNTNIDFIEESKNNVLLLSLNAVHRDKERSFVMVKPDHGGKPMEQAVTLGISDDKNVEIVAGLTEQDDIILKIKKYSPSQNSSSTNPFMPPRPGAQKR